MLTNVLIIMRMFCLFVCIVAYSDDYDYMLMLCHQRMLILCHAYEYIEIQLEGTANPNYNIAAQLETANLDELVNTIVRLDQTLSMLIRLVLGRLMDDVVSFKLTAEGQVEWCCCATESKDHKHLGLSLNLKYD